MISQFVVTPSPRTKSRADICAKKNAYAQPLWHEVDDIEYRAGRGGNGVEYVIGSDVQDAKTVDGNRYLNNWLKTKR